MAELGAIDEDVAFDHVVADDLSGTLRSLARLLEWQNPEREVLRSTARAAWEGRYGDEFDHRVGLCCDDADGVVTALRGAADGLDELARLAGEEQARREAAREWVAAQDDGDGWGVVGDVVDSGHDLLFGDDAPPPPPPVEPPTIPIGDPGTTTREASPAAPVPVWPSGGTSAAKPDDLDTWTGSVQDFDDAVTTRRGALVEDHDTFTSTLGWGAFDATSLISAVGTWVGLNATDRAWVAEIAQAFRDAGSGTLSDDVIQDRLDAAGLDGPRRSATYDAPLLWGEPPTSGYADDPVNTASGNFVEREVDLDVGGLGRLLRFERVHNSRSDRVGPFGRGWASWASCRLRAEPDGAHWVGPDGQEVIVARARPAVGGYVRVAGLPGLVVADGDGLVLERFDDVRLRFDPDGRPRSAELGPGTRVLFDHDAAGRLVAMAHGGGRSVRLEWHDQRIVGLHCSDSRSVRYHYDDRDRLVGTDGGPRGRRSYELDEQGRVVAVTDADGVVEARNTYDDDGRVVAQLSPLGRRTRYRYLGGRVTTVDDEGTGPVNSYVHDEHGRLVSAIDGDGQALHKAYDRWGNPTEVTERDGAVTRLEWDERARLVRRERADGMWLAFAYDDRGRLVEASSSSGTATRYGYSGDERLPTEIVDAEGAVTRLDVRDGAVRAVTDPDGVTVRYTYDEHGELTAITDAEGGTTTLERDAAGRVTAMTSALGARHELEYDDVGRPVAHRDPVGGERRFEWSPAGRLRAVVDPTGARRELRYGRDGTLREVVDETGAVTRRQIDPLGNVTAVDTTDGATWQFEYDRLCRLTATRDPLGAVWSRDHDVAGRLVATTDPAGVRRELEYDRVGRVVRMADAVTSVEVELSPQGWVRSVRRPDGSETGLTYDRCGRITSIVDPEDGVRRFGYTPAGRLASVTSPLGHVTRFEHDRCGRRTAVIDPLGHRWGCAYDADGRVVRIESPLAEVIAFRYDPAGRLVARTSSAGGVTTYDHDANGWVVAATDPCGGVVRLERDVCGRLVAAVDANGATTRHGRDAQGRVREIVDPLGGRTELAHDPAGRLARRTDPLGRSTDYAYDPGGRLAQRTLPTGERRLWWYDASGRVRGLGVAPDEGPVVEVARDGLGRAVEVREPRFRHELRWDRRGRLVARSRNGLGLRWRYDRDGRRTAVVCADGSEIRYGHDAVGRLTSIAHDATGTVRVDRDATGRPVVRATATGRQRWHYAAGALVGYQDERGGVSTATSLDRDAAGRVVAVASAGRRSELRYDRAGQLVAVDGPEGTRTFTYDAAGRLVAETGPSGDTVATYDAAHQLLERRGPSGVVRFSYDAAGRRTHGAGPDGEGRVHDWDWAGRLCRVGGHHLRVDALGDMAEIDGRPLLWDPVGAIPRLRWADGVTVVGDDRPLAAVGPEGDTSWLTSDWQGTIAAHGGRDPWGAPAGIAGAAGTPGFGYRGELVLDGLVWLRHRAYDPATRSFLSTDPLPGVPGTPVVANAYHYAGNDPVDTLDPLGLRPMTDADLATYREAAGHGLLDTAGDWLEAGGRGIVGGGMVAVGFLGALNPLGPVASVLPEPLRPLVALGNPIHTATGLGQAGLAFVNGERDLDDLGRHVINGPSTTLGQGLAIMGGGDLSYDEEHGIWVSEDTADWTSGRGGTTYGNIFVTPSTEQEIEDSFRRGNRPHGWGGLLTHEARHSDQWAQYGGGIGFPIVYGIEEWTSGGEGCNRYEREAGLDEGNYDPC